MWFLEKVWKIWENIELLAINILVAERRRNCLVSEPNYQTTKFFTEKIIN